MSQVRRQSAVLPRPNWGWQDAAACKGEDLLLFFGPDGERQPEREIRERKAKGVCAVCWIVLTASFWSRRLCFTTSVTLSVLAPDSRSAFSFNPWNHGNCNQRVTLV